MSKEIYEFTQEQIHFGFDRSNQLIIQRETYYVVSKLITSMMTVFQDKINGIKISNTSFSFSTDYLLSEKHKNNLLKWLDRLVKLEAPATDLDFGKIKIDLESWYYQLGGEHIEFVYQDSYLLTPQEAAKALGTSKVTLNKYIKQGLECLDNGRHNKIPIYTIEIMRDPVYSIRMQAIAQEKKLRNQTPAGRFAEINEDLSKLQLKYRTMKFEDAFKGYDGDEMDDPTDYYRWNDLLEEMSDILKLGGGNV